MIRILFLIMVLFSSSALADKEAPAASFTVFSENKMYYAEVTPDAKGSYDNGNLGETVVYESGSKKMLWAVGWYGACDLTNDGKRLIGFNNFLRSDNLRETILVFFENGKELNRYSLGDFIQDKSKLERTVSHFIWWNRVEGDGINEDNIIYKITFSDGVVRKFDLSLGTQIKE